MRTIYIKPERRKSKTLMYMRELMRICIGAIVFLSAVLITSFLWYLILITFPNDAKASPEYIAFSTAKQTMITFDEAVYPSNGTLRGTILINGEPQSVSGEWSGLGLATFNGVEYSVKP